MPAPEILISIAEDLAETLGPPHRARQDYAFPVFDDSGGVTVRHVDAAVFTTPSPSVSTALCALTATNGRSEQDVLQELGYFGSPLAVVRDGSQLSAYRFIAPRVPRKLETIDIETAEPWTRTTLAREASAAAQLELPLSEGRDVLITDARRALSRLVSNLIVKFQDAGTASAADAFDAAIRAIRSELFNDPIDDPTLQAVVRPYREALRFPHVPLEAVAELYETLGLEARERRDRGIAYTPAWIADHLVRRLPSTAFSNGRAVDPTCGSGTFLVAYLDRLVAERARRHVDTVVEDLVAAVAGADLDRVALATSRLTLDLFAQRLGHSPQPWTLSVADATQTTVSASVLIGNLPFGYRTHEGRDDISSVILRKWLETEAGIESLALVLPDSFAYAGGAMARARTALRQRFRVDELIELPEEAFERTSAATLAVVANRGEGGTPVVRDVRRRDLAAFRVTGVAGRSFVAQLPPVEADPWPLTPFFGALERAEARAVASLGRVADVRMGFQSYGSAATFDHDVGGSPRVLEDSSRFIRLAETDQLALRQITSGPESLRRSGPVDLYVRPKLIVRATTNRHQVARLATLLDETGLWFNDKFIGIWPAQDALPIGGLAVYLQTAFCELWIATMNPSRKLRIGTLKRLPVPELPKDWWERAARLARPGQTVASPRWLRREPTLLDDAAGDIEEWEWFEHVVAAAFGMSTADLSDVEQYLAEYLTVGRLD